ncbi:hypothetical protein ACFTE1_16965 [Salininema proteolyticum]|uniref:hypothetical protein n=1 Tax=Salininema proteolyticum TaxID=1607685 RepID=UPI00363E2937
MQNDDQNALLDKETALEQYSRLKNDLVDFAYNGPLRDEWAATVIGNQRMVDIDQTNFYTTSSSPLTT